MAETMLGDLRLIVRRTRLVGAQAELWPDWRHHCFATNRTIPTLIADVDHRDHATIELVIRDLKDQALAHFPSGQMHANSAWTAIAALAHNLGRWSTLIGLPDRPVQTARARRRHLLKIPGRLTRTSRQWTLRMPARWPWQTDFTTVLDAIRALPARNHQPTVTAARARLSLPANTHRDIHAGGPTPHRPHEPGTNSQITGLTDGDPDEPTNPPQIGDFRLRA